MILYQKYTKYKSKLQNLSNKLIKCLSVGTIVPPKYINPSEAKFIRKELELLTKDPSYRSYIKNTTQIPILVVECLIPRVKITNPIKLRTYR